METRRDRTVTIAVVTGVITLLLGLCLGAIAGGMGGYLIGRGAGERAAGTGAQGFTLPREFPGPFGTPLPGQVAGGVVVDEVVTGSPAEAAGIQAGDIITQADGVPLDANHNLSDLLQRYKPGDKIRLTLSRGNQVRTVTVDLGARVDNQNSAYLGIRYRQAQALPLSPVPTP